MILTTIQVIICIAIIVILALAFFIITSSQPVVVIDKYVKQRMEPKPKVTTISKQPMCGIDYYNIIVDYYIIDSTHNTHKISEQQYWNTQLGDSIKVNTKK